jgi:ELWxxDGT repeat protein
MQNYSISFHYLLTIMLHFTMLASPCFGQAPYLVKDIVSSGTEDSDAGGYTICGNRVYFKAQKPPGYYLFRTDGTPHGTEEVMLLYSSEITPYIEPMTGKSDEFKQPNYRSRCIDGRYYFSVYDDAMFLQIWRTDGTPAGTEKLTDFPPLVPEINFYIPEYLTPAGDSLYFIYRRALWRLELIKGRLMLLAEFPMAMVDPLPQWLTTWGSEVSFVGWDAAHGHELWMTDSSTNQLHMVCDVLEGEESSSPEWLTVVGDTLYFSARESNGRRQLWRSDGTAEGTIRLTDLEPQGAPWDGPRWLSGVGDTLFFAATHIEYYPALWRSDGTSEGTYLVRSTEQGGPEFPEHITDFNGVAYFFNRGFEASLWRSDGTSAGTYPVTAIGTPVANSFSVSAQRFAFNNQDCLWLSDGTETGTFCHINTNKTSKTWFGDRLIFTAGDSSTGMEPWVTDGSPDGTFMLQDINTSTAGSYPRNLTNVSGTLYFTTVDDNGNTNIHVSDGTGDGTRLVTTVRGDWQYRCSAGINSRLVFAFSTSEYGEELWRSTGRADETHILLDINPGPGGSFPKELVAIGDAGYFTAESPGSGRELWRTDGTTYGTRMVKDIRPGAEGSDPAHLTRVGDRLFFTAHDDDHGRELWQSDGTRRGTFMVTDYFPGDVPFQGFRHDYVELAALGNRLIYSIDNQLFVSDGTGDGTHLIAELERFFIRGLTATRSLVFFIGYHDKYGWELWRTDGTAKGTVMVKDICPGPDSFEFRKLHPFGDRLFFAGWDGQPGSEVWVSDGTAEGTYSVGDIDRSGGYSWKLRFHYAHEFDDLIFLSLHRRKSAREPVELWVTDGSPDSIRQINGVSPAPYFGSLPWFTTLGDQMLFSAGDWRHQYGVELWAIDKRESPRRGAPVGK